MTNTRNVMAGAVAEYVAGLYAGGLIARVVAPLVALAITLVGLCDAASGWRLSIPLWAHIVSTLTFSVGLFVIAAGHIRRTRHTGRRFLNEIGRA